MEKNFKDTILKLENSETNKTYIIKKGKLPVILTAPHTMIQKRKDGTIKLNEPYTKAIAMYIGETLNCSYIIKTKDTGVDSNWEKIETLKKNLLNIINEQNIKLLLDIHGASKERKFDIELGNLDNLSCNYITIEKLKETFLENGIENVELNNPFKGGGITKFAYNKTNIDAIQIEINKRYRDVNNIENIEKVCNSIIKFIKEYTKMINNS